MSSVDAEDGLPQWNRRLESEVKEWRSKAPGERLVARAQASGVEKPVGNVREGEEGRATVSWMIAVSYFYNVTSSKEESRLQGASVIRGGLFLWEFLVFELLSFGISRKKTNTRIAQISRVSMGGARETGGSRLIRERCLLCLLGFYRHHFLGLGLPKGRKRSI